MRTYSPECLDRIFCSQCTYEDCACRCHLYEHLREATLPDESELPDENFGNYIHDYLEGSFRMKTCAVCKEIVEEADIPVHLLNNHRGPHFFFFDGIRWKTMRPSMQVKELKELVGASMSYYVYRQDAENDRYLSDAETIDLTRLPHFYAVPVATI